MQQPVTTPPPCRKCNGPTKLSFRRTDGGPFWGCANYPECRGARDSHPDIRCPDDDGEMRIKRSKKYAGKNKGLFWGCENWPKCTNTHGAHEDGMPFGIPADSETRTARIIAHEAFDWIWDQAKAKRSRQTAYRWLAAQLGEEEVHISWMDAEECRRVVDICDGVSWEDVAKWDAEARAGAA